MNQPRNLPAWVKPVLEFGPALLFLVVFLALREKSVMLGGTTYKGFTVATMVFVPVQVVATLILWRLTGKLSAMQIMTIVLILVFGGMTVWLNDPRFLEMKPTILYLGFAVILGIGVLLGKNWLGMVMSEALPMREEGWRILTFRLIGLFIVLAILNEIVRRTMSETAWVYFKTFGMIAIIMGFFMLNARLFERYAIQKDGDDSK